jgi:hypothetical protein
MQRRGPKGRQGIGLALVMLVTMLLLVLSGAFVSVNSNQLQQLTNGIQRARAEEACKSALNYAWMRLDQDMAWATPGYFDKNPKEAWPPALADKARLQAQGVGNRVTGEILGTDQRFDMRVFNNLNNDSADLVQRVPARSVRISLDGMNGPVRRHYEVVLRRKAFVDASAVSQLDLSILNALPMKWNLESTDALLNIVRSNSYIVGPKAGLTSGTSEIEFRRPSALPSAAAGPFRTAWAKNDILLEGRSLGTSDTDRQTASSNAKGNFLPKTGVDYQIPDLAPEDLNGPSTKRVVPGGRYQFKIAGTAVASVPAQDAVAYQPAVDPVVDPITGVVISPGIPEVLARDAVPAVAGFTQWNQSLEYTDPSGKVTVLKEVETGKSEDDVPPPLDKDVWVPLALDPNTGERTDHSVMANLKTCQIIVAPGIRAVVPSGDLVVDGQLGSGNVGLGIHVEGSPQDTDKEKNKDKDESDKDDDDRDRDRRNRDRKGDKDKPKPTDLVEPASLEAENGSIDIYGAATGWGSMVAKDNLNLRMKSAIATDPDFGVALYAGKDVTMRSARDSYGVEAAGANFQGLIYAMGSFRVFGGQQRKHPSAKCLRCDLPL